MKAAELIQKLSELDPDAEVLVDGYESGYDEPNLVASRAAYRGRDSEMPYVFGVWTDRPWGRDAEAVPVWVLSRSK